MPRAEAMRDTGEKVSTIQSRREDLQNLPPAHHWVAVIG